MRQILLVLGGAVTAAALVTILFSYNQAARQRSDLTARLESRSILLAESLATSVESSVRAHATTTLRNIVDNLTKSERIGALVVFDVNTRILASSRQDAPDAALASSAMDGDAAYGELVPSASGTTYSLAIPLHDDDGIIGALMISQDASYIDDSIAAIWRDNILRLLAQVAIVLILTFILVYWIFYASIWRFTRSLQDLRKGDHDGSDFGSAMPLFSPLAGEISKVTQNLLQARAAASEEARMRLEKIDAPWTAVRLTEFIRANVKDRPIYVLSNSEPYVHSKERGTVTWSVPAGGVVTALEPVLKACGGTWIAHARGSADMEVVDAQGKLRVPPDEPAYTLKRIALSDDIYRGYYSGFSNEALWPLCLMAHTRPIFRASDWEAYKRANATFASALLEEIKRVEQPVILVQDYHLALVPQIIKRARPDAKVAIFWHIPWPSAAQFSICPYRKAILDGMLGADVIGFHTQQHCNNFVDTISHEIESRIDYENMAVLRGEHATFLRSFPISIAYTVATEEHVPTDKAILGAYGVQTPKVILGVDRLDYTKGILERFKALEFLLEKHPEHAEKTTLLQIAAPTRETVEKYREYSRLVDAEVDRINARFATKQWRPIRYIKKHHSHAELARLYRVADVCLITSLHDGMNLVAKEYVAARTDEEGVLILSAFAGASRDMHGAIIVNPYSAEETSAAIHEALSMPKSDQHRRMRQMRQSVRDYNVYRWSAELIKSLMSLT